MGVTTTPVEALDLQARADAYARMFPGRPPLQVVWEGAGADRHQVVYGQWLIGQDYRNKTRYYGAYPAGYLDRVLALFPDLPSFHSPMGRPRHLHVFSGSLPAGDYVRCDLRQDAEIQASVYDLNPAAHGRYDLVLADPPYSAADAEKYGTAMVDRRRAMAALARVTRIGGFLVWLDTVWPMHRKDEWVTVGRIGVVRSTNHRVRLVSLFQRREGRS